MKLISKSLVAVFLSAAMFLTSAAQAMEIRQFDKMSGQDQGDYIGDLIVGAEKVLTDEGKSELAAQVKHLFTTKDPGDLDVIGMVEFEMNLALARVADAKRAEKDPNARRIEVEDAMAVTLKKNHIELPDSFFTVNKNFKPKFPLQTNDAKKQDDKTQSPASYAPQWMGQNIVIVGTVSRVEVAPSGSPQWVTIYFKESPNAAFVVCSPYPDLFQEKVGLDLSVLVGKTMEAAGQVESPYCGHKVPKASIRVVESKQWQLR